VAHDGQGTIYIPLEEFWAFVRKYAPGDGAEEVRFGVPRATDGDIEIDYAFSTECAPEGWSKKPPAVTQWEELRERRKRGETP
jgi:hypothetical protein